MIVGRKLTDPSSQAHPIPLLEMDDTYDEDNPYNDLPNAGARKSSRGRHLKYLEHYPISDDYHAYKSEKAARRAKAWQYHCENYETPRGVMLPVVVGADSVYANAEAIQSFYQLPNPPRTEQTTISSSGWLIIAIKDDRADSPPVTVCLLSHTHIDDLEFRTLGRKIDVWLDDRPITCWWPTAFREGLADPTRQHAQEDGKGNGLYGTLWKDEDGELRESLVPLRKWRGRWGPDGEKVW